MSFIVAIDGPAGSGKGTVTNLQSTFGLKVQIFHCRSVGSRFEQAQ